MFNLCDFSYLLVVIWYFVPCFTSLLRKPLRGETCWAETTLHILWPHEFHYDSFYDHLVFNFCICIIKLMWFYNLNILVYWFVWNLKNPICVSKNICVFSGCGAFITRYLADYQKITLSVWVWHSEAPNFPPRSVKKATSWNCKFTNIWQPYPRSKLFYPIPTSMPF